jgi:hypothetical protein
MYNAMLHTTIGHAPVNVHKNAALWPGVAKKIRGQAVKSKGARHWKLPPVSVGDTVRIALIRKPLEKPETYWSRELYEVIEVIPARAACVFAELWRVGQKVFSRMPINSHDF